MSFEIFTRNSGQSIVARTLDQHSAQLGHVTLEILNGVVINREDNSQVQTTLCEEYSHGTLALDTTTGFIQFNVLPYSVIPYPTADVNFSDVLVNHTENKTWAIRTDKNGEEHVAFCNDKTLNRLVYQRVNQSKTKKERIDEKLSKGYVRIKACRFDSKTRELK